MKKKNKRKAALKRQKKGALRKVLRQGKGRTPRILSEKDWPQETQMFWVSHGVNYLLSDYNEGTWTPLFPEIYEGDMPTSDVLAQRVIDRFKDNDKLTPNEKATLAWSCQDPRVIRQFTEKVHRSLRKAKVEDPETVALSPHNSLVWELFNELHLGITNG